MVSRGIRVDRYGCLRRPLRMSASTVTDVCVDRYGCLRRPMRMVKYAEGVGKKRCVEGVWEVCGRCVRGVWEVCEGCVGGVGRVRGRCGKGAWVWQDAIPSYGRSL